MGTAAVGTTAAGVVRGLAFLLGLVMGSFFNVVAYRLPLGRSVVHPPSSCPSCGTRLGPRELVPVLSYLLQAGRCRHCRARISPLYPGVELATGALFALVVTWYGLTARSLYALLLVSLLVITLRTDLERQVIPNTLVLSGLAGWLPLWLLAQPLSLGEALGGLVLGAGFFLLPALVFPQGIGGGDIKLAGVMGLYLGWRLTLVALLLAVFAGAAVAVGLLVTGRKRRTEAIPFGPFLVLGGLAALFWGEALIHWYVGRMGF